MRPREREQRPLQPAVRFRTGEHKERDGRLFKVEVPIDWPDDNLQAGIPVGPPDFDARMKERGIPKVLRIAIHNQLYRRGLLTLKDAQRRSPELRAVLTAALKEVYGLTDSTLHQWFYEEGS